MLTFQPIIEFIPQNLALDAATAVDTRVIGAEPPYHQGVVQGDADAVQGLVVVRTELDFARLRRLLAILPIPEPRLLRPLLIATLVKGNFGGYFYWDLYSSEIF